MSNILNSDFNSSFDWRRRVFELAAKERSSTATTTMIIFNPFEDCVALHNTTSAPKLGECFTDLLVPTSSGLFHPIEGLEQLAHIVHLSVFNKAWWLNHINGFGELHIQVNIFDIYLFDLSVIQGS